MIYIHVPYCRSFCTYCGFYSEIPDCGFEAYVNALCREIVARRGEIPWEHNTLYIGGGTPSVLPLGALRRVVETIGKTNFDEFTVEVNPDDIVRLGVEYVRGLVSLGVNRISMGVQSLDDRVLKWMNRRHSAATARQAYRIIREGGIDNISVDLIFGFGDICAAKSNVGALGVPDFSSACAGEGSDGAADCSSDFPSACAGEGSDGAADCSSDFPSACAGEGSADAADCSSDFPSACAGEGFDSTEILEKTIEGFFGLGGDGTLPRHISAYQLSIEPESELAKMAERGEYVPASDEVCARQYEILCSRLAAAGYHHYEISNFAQPGFEARHNSAYWHHVPYIGFGPSAHSFFIKKDPSSLRGKGCAAYESEAEGGVPIGCAASETKGEEGRFSLEGEYVRQWNRPDLCAYLKAAETGDWDSVSEGEVLTSDQIREERIMLALRTDTGLPASELPDFEKLMDEGCLEIVKTGSESRLRIPENKFFISDSIISELF